jgi:hypothetical protein
MMQSFSRRTLRTLAVTNALALLLAGPLAALGPALAQYPPYPPPAPYPGHPRPAYTPAPVPAAPQPPGVVPSAGMPADLAGLDQPWPRVVDAQGLKVTIYQPQVEWWNGSILNLKAAVGLDGDAPNAFDRHFGAIWIAARTDVDKDRRVVWLADMQVVRAVLPTAPHLARVLDDALDGQPGILARVIALDQLQAGLAIAEQQRGREQAVEVLNDPPRILISAKPAVLVALDGEPVLRAVAPSLERVVNTSALVLREASSGRYFLRVAGYWATAPGLDGPWAIAYQAPPVFDRIKQQALEKGGVDLLDDDDRPGPYGVLPEIVVSTVPTELLRIDGAPQYAPIDGTRLLYVENTLSDIFVDTAGQDFYVLVSGRWFRARGLEGPWSYVDSAELPADFRRIPERHPKGAVLASIAGTPQAEAAIIASAIPRTATIDRQAATFAPVYDGEPQFVPVEGTALRYAANAPVPVVMVDSHSFYAVDGGVWFTAPSPYGPWIVASAVPAVIYTIPPTSPIHYCTYVRVYAATPRYVKVGYTPGYLGTYVTRRGVVVYGSGHRYRPWIGRSYFARPATYGVGAGSAAGAFAGFAVGLASAATIASPLSGPRWDGGRSARRDREDARAGRPPETVRRSGPAVVSVTTNVYDTWGGRAVVRQPPAQPAAPSAGPGPGTRHDVFLGSDGSPHRQGPRGTERLDHPRDRQAGDPARRDRQRPDRPPASAPAAVRSTTMPPPAAMPRFDDAQRRAAEERRRQEEQARRAAGEALRRQPQPQPPAQARPQSTLPPQARPQPSQQAQPQAQQPQGDRRQAPPVQGGGRGRDRDGRKPEERTP